MRSITYHQALNEALHQEMERDSTVFIYGIGIPDHKKFFGTTTGLAEKFGSDRCFDTPISEDAMTGFGLGAAINGMRPIHTHMRVDFMLLAMNQLANMVSSFRYGSGGTLKVPLVVRAVIGRSWGQSYQHSKSMQSIFAHIPGLKVVMPTTPRDAKGLLISAIRDDNPVIFIEHRLLYYVEDQVPETNEMIPLGEANCLRRGNDISIVATSWMCVEALHAADLLAKRGISVEVIDPRTISPFNDQPIVESVKKTSHCVVVDNDWVNCGFSAEVAARVSERCFHSLKSPVTRIGFAFTPCPCTKPLENTFYPNAETIVRTIESKLGLEPMDLSSETFYDHQNQFKGPF